jgi:predicted DNA-binding transcriptional regulator AlpA
MSEVTTPTESAAPLTVTPSRKRYESARQLGARLGVSVATIWRWQHEKKIPAPTKFSPRCSRFDSDAVDAALEKLEGKYLPDTEHARAAALKGVPERQKVRRRQARAAKRAAAAAARTVSA